ncbi:MAG: class I SAM-dependent rRNA methyltransferase, partial [Bacteroidota bacterium]
MNYPKIILKPGKEAAVERFHPWLFSGAVARTEGNPAEGDIVELFSSKKEYLATGHWLKGSIVVKIFSWIQAEINEEYWKARIRKAFSLRQNLRLTDNDTTNAYRLVFSEGDELPGLFVDFYNGTAVIQTHTIGMHNIKPVLVDALKEIYGEKLVAVYDKSADTMQMEHRTPEARSQKPETVIQNQYLFGSPHSGQIKEIGHDFKVDWENGQKTGFFLDQRSNRMFAQFYAKDRKVLNAFCYSGAFSVYAAKGGATLIHSVDSSKQAIEWTDENIKLNKIVQKKHKSFVAEAKKYLSETEERYDMIILDPPAFAKHQNVSHNALQAYI